MRTSIMVRANEAEPKRDWQVIRPILAWLCACWASALSVFVPILASWIFNQIGAGVVWDATDISQFVGEVVSVSLMGAGLIAIFTAIPTLFLVLLLRATGAPRGWSDLIAGSVLGAALSVVVLFQSLMMSPAQVALFASLGAVGGLTYWLAAGRPRSQEASGTGA